MLYNKKGSLKGPFLIYFPTKAAHVEYKTKRPAATAGRFYRYAKINFFILSRKTIKAAFQALYRSLYTVLHIAALAHFHSST
jgi:hypothetical protein